MERKGCGRSLLDVVSVSVGDYEQLGSNVYDVGFWDTDYPCGCSNYEDRDDLTADLRVEWILCEDCAIKFGFIW
jgi:hypothetical protein